MMTDKRPYQRLFYVLLALGYCVVQIRCGNVLNAHENVKANLLPEDNISENSTRINGGSVVQQIVPYQISLQVKRRGSWHHFCSGSIISTQHALTAAHCIEKMKADQISVVAGTLNRKQGGDRHMVVASRTHPYFSMNPRIVYDIAVLKVSPAFNLRKSNIAAISFSGTCRLGAKVPVRLTGWGSMTPTATNRLPDNLQKLDYHTITNEECSRKGFRVTWNELCALAQKGQGACVGDSGGPLVTLHGVEQLVGIVSYGKSVCAMGKPDVYTRVSNYYAYINQVINKEIP